uniref:Uncharacterized protein n=1 Tax=viral metagenome TaxID=1070528 RepID=A0A6C0F8Y0_9ZZZZ
MHCCKNCCKEFKTNWQLQRHLSKKIACKEVPPITTQVPPITTEVPPITTQDPPITTQDPPITTQSLTCEFCLVEFSRTDSLKRHKEVCPWKNDEVRNLESKLGIKISIDTSSTICRFCNIKCSRKDSLHRHHQICKMKENYKEHLKQLVQAQRTSTINNTTNNNINNDNSITNTTINNNTINLTVNSIGCENLSYMNSEMIQKLRLNALSDSEFMANSVASIHADENHPENHNIIYNNLRSNVALVKLEDTFEYRNVDEVITKIMNNWLNNLIFTERYDDLPNHLKQKYEEIGEDDKLANSMIKTRIYNNSKKMKQKSLQ